LRDHPGATVSRAAVFRALAEGADLTQVQEQFGLTRNGLQNIFQEVADYYNPLEEGVWTLYCDGASRGNPGPAGAGVVLVDPYGEVARRNLEYLGQTTNNVAEYRSLLLGLKMAQNLGIKKIRLCSDSELLVRQLNGSYRVKNPDLLALWQQARQGLARFETVEITHVPRELNYQADRLANQAIDQGRLAR
jgi:ribonuclease HI